MSNVTHASSLTNIMPFSPLILHIHSVNRNWKMLNLSNCYANTTWGQKERRKKSRFISINVIVAAELKELHKKK